MPDHGDAHDAIASRLGGTLGSVRSIDDVQEHVYRVTTARGTFLVKQLRGKGAAREISADERLRASGETIGLVTESLVDYGVDQLGVWPWIEGGDLRSGKRHLLPDAFGALGAFHLRHRYRGDVTSIVDEAVYSTVDDLVESDKAKLLPELTDETRTAAARLLDRLKMAFPTWCHGDVHPGNIVEHEGGLRLVDWALTKQSLNVFDLDYVESVPLVPPTTFWAYMRPPESDAVLEAYAGAIDWRVETVRHVHLAVLLLRDLVHLRAALRRSQPDPREITAVEGRIEQMLALAG